MMSLLRELVQLSVRTLHRSTPCMPMLSTTGSCGAQFETLRVGSSRSRSANVRWCYVRSNNCAALSSFFKVRSDESLGLSLASERSTESKKFKTVRYEKQTLSRHFINKTFIGSQRIFNSYEMLTACHCTTVRFFVTNSTKASCEDTNKHPSSSGKSSRVGDTTETPKFSNTACKVPQRHDMVLTIPNVLTFLRMVLTPVLGYLVLTGSYATGCGVFIVASITDLLDGFIARHFPNQTSALGSFIDPLADKLLVSTLFVSLTLVNLIPVALTSLVIARDICLMSAGFYVRYISLNPRPKSLKQYFDVTNASAHLRPTTISKLNTGVQLSLVAFTLASPVFGYVDHPALQALWYITAASTVISGIGYVYAKDTFKILQQTRNKSG